MAVPPAAAPSGPAGSGRGEISPRAAGEAAACAAVAVGLAWHRRAAVGPAAAAGLVGLAVAAGAVDTLLRPGPLAAAGPRAARLVRSARDPEGFGLAAGASALPWVLCASALSEADVIGCVAASGLLAGSVGLAGARAERRRLPAPVRRAFAAGFAAAALLALRALAGRPGPAAASLALAAPFAVAGAALGGCPRTFSLGEAWFCAHGASLAAAALWGRLQACGAGGTGVLAADAAGRASALTAAFLALALAAPAAWAAAQAAVRRWPGARSTSAAEAAAWAPAAAAGAVCAAGLAALPGRLAQFDAGGPLVWLAGYTAEHTGVLAYWAAALAAGLPTLHWAARRTAGRPGARIFVRKGFHLLALALFAPVHAVAFDFLGLGLAGCLLLFVLAECVRAGAPKGRGGLAARLDGFLGNFVDGRDEGSVIISHISLLVGMGVPVWLEGSGVSLASLSGYLTLGLMDVFAVVFGRAFGRHPLYRDSKKTVEGTLGGFAAAAAACALLAAARPVPLAQVWTALAVVAVLEASTSQLDNLFMPVQLYALLKAVGV